MATIQVVLDNKLLKATDLAARRHKVNRSAFIREALQHHIKLWHHFELEEQDRRGYLAKPQREDEFRIWEDAAWWPRPWAEAKSACADFRHRTNSVRF